MTVTDETHVAFMRRALRLAVKGRHASPNPMVGCVLTDAEGHPLASGYHVAPGSPHAEAMALSRLGDSGAAVHTAYVSLEPCSHYARTPPCADALIAAGIQEVFVAMEDPDVRVAGRGIGRLRAHGVKVHVGMLETEARRINPAYIKHRTTGMPYVTVKSAMTLDGKIATATGDSQWISSTISRKAVHRQLRDRCDAILTGIGTVLADDPSLTTRLIHRRGRDPWRIVVDSHLRTPRESRLVRQAGVDGRTIIVTGHHVPLGRTETFRDQGCHVMQCGTDSDGRILLPELLADLGGRGDITSVVVEAGGGLVGRLMSGGHVDRFLLYIAPRVAGGAQAPGPVGDPGVAHMAEAFDLRFQTVRRSGPDIVIDAHWVK